MIDPETAEFCNSATLKLSDYDISAETGFIPAHPPLERLPGESFAPWENLMLQLPELNRTRRLRAEVDKLPETDFSHATLKSEEEWRRACVLLSFIGQSYVWGEGQKNLVDVVPKKIAVPWCRVSDHLGLCPVGCYASTVLYNFRLKNPATVKEWDFGNIAATSLFTGTEDESGFYMSFVLIELAAAPGLRAIARIFDLIHSSRHERDDCHSAVQSCLHTIKYCLREIRGVVKKMAERCKPVTFYTDIRPFQAGSKGLDALPKGITYEGVDSEPRQYRGANGGQSSVIYAIDIALGTKHYGQGRDFISEMKLYMPEKHRKFLERLAKESPVRDYCKKSGNSSLIASFNSTIEELARFRTDHVILVTRYIVNQSRHGGENPTLTSKGSGGTDFMQMLKKVRNETLKFVIT